LLGNILWQNTNVGLYLAGTAAELDFNDYGAIGGVAPFNKQGNVSTKPKFVDPANGNYHLAGDSPLLTYCSSARPVYPFDLVGNYYPSTGFVDIGAYEETIFIDGFEP